MRSSAEPSSVAASWPPFRLRELRLIPRIERSPTIVEFAQTLVGRAVLLGVYGLILFVHGDWHKWFAPLALAAPTFAPAHRRKCVALITLAILIVRPYASTLDVLARGHGVRSMTMFHCALTLAALGICALVAWVSLARPTSILGKSPVATVLGAFVALLFLGSLFPPGSGLAALFVWALLVALSHFLWFLCYTVKNRRPRTLKELALEIGRYSPFWYTNAGAGGTPVPKGSSFLDKIEAKTPEALAVCQLKGIKLTLWALLLAWLHDALLALAYGPNGLGIAPFQDAMALSIAGRPLPFYEGWAALFAHFFIDTLLKLAIGLHFAVGMARMAGFNALRGVYRPFSARGFADFWNRVHYYFKELMVELFFYPVYFRLAKLGPRLRAVVAIFAAAFFGNWLYHVLRDVEWIGVNGPLAALVKWKTYAVYTLLLAIGIAISEIRRQRRAEPVSGPAGAFGAAVVMISYGLLGVFDENGGASITECAGFVVNLFPKVSL